MYRIGGVMVSMLASCTVDRGFDSLLDQKKTIKLIFAKTGCLETRKMCPSGVTCLPVDCCFSELAL